MADRLRPMLGEALTLAGANGRIAVVDRLAAGSTGRRAVMVGNEEFRRHLVTAECADPVRDRGHRRALQQAGGLNELFDGDPASAVLHPGTPAAQRERLQTDVPF